MPLNIYTFLRIGGGMANNKTFRAGVSEHMMEFRSLFGMGPDVCLDLWHRCRQSMPAKATPKHLLWALHFLKVYGTEANMSSRAKTTRKTFRKWVRKMLGAITAICPYVVCPVYLLRLFWTPFDAKSMFWLTLFLLLFVCQINWQNRFMEDRGKTCKVTVDGTDFRIQQQHPFSKKWYSYKFRGPAVRYEVAVCIQTGEIVWINGPYPPGRWNDVTIFKHKLIHLLSPGEKVEADDGYRGYPNKIRTPGMFFSQSDLRSKSRARGRHETVNKRFKQWGCLKQVFRHGVNDHYLVFASVAVCTQLCIENGEPLFAVRY